MLVTRNNFWAVAGRSIMADSEIWTLFYDWKDDGIYNSLIIILNSDGTWATEGYSGLWTQTDETFILTFNSSRITYTGKRQGQFINGTMPNLEGAKGCFYMLPKGKLSHFMVDILSPLPTQADQASKNSIATTNRLVRT